MFAAGRGGIASAEASARLNERDGDGGGGDAWLNAGRSFQGDDQSAGTQISVTGKNSAREKKKHKHDRESVVEGRTDRSRALVVHKRHRSKSEKRSKKSKKSKDDKRRKKRRHRRSEYSSTSSVSGSESSECDTDRHLVRQRRSRSRSPRREQRLVSTEASRDLARSKSSCATSIGAQEKLFEVDRVGDHENRFFGSVYAGDQPLYSLATRRAVGTGEWVASSRSLRNSVRLDTQRKREREQQGAERYFGVNARRAERAGQQTRLYLAYSDKRRGRQNDSRTDASAEMSYIPLDPVADAGLVDGADTEDGEKTTSRDVVLLTDAQSAEQLFVTRTKLFNASLAENPHDVDGWLDFMAFQDQSLQLVQGKDKKAFTAAQRSVFDKQAAILEKAVALNPTSRELQRAKINLKLHSSRLQDGGDGHDTVLQLLEVLIAQDPTDPALWIKLIECHQQNFGNFSVPSIRDLFARVFAVYRKQYGNGDDDAASVEKLSGLLVHFHSLMCAFEHKTGHLEHAIAHLQALYDFNANIIKPSPSSDDFRSHHDRLSHFVDRWSRDLARVGDAGSLIDDALRELLDQSELPTESGLNEFVESKRVTQLREINPPDMIRSTEHKQLLLSSSAAYRRRVNRLRTPQSAMDVSYQNNGDDMGSRSGEFDRKEDGRVGGRLMYSNLHGYRIRVDEANDAAEYERILSELRGTEASQARQEQVAAREEKRLEGVNAAAEAVEDQRADYNSVSRGDPFVMWLAREEAQELTQWQPLWATRVAHQDLIEASPERAVLTDELQPFLFKISPRYQWMIVSNLLAMCGVYTTSVVGDAHQDSSVYADTFSTDCSQLVKPLLRALDATCRTPLAMPRQERLRLLKKGLERSVRIKKVTTLDRERVAFIRRVLAQSIASMPAQRMADGSWSKEPSSQMVKCLWIGFETELAARCCESGVTGDAVTFARSVSQLLLQEKSPTASKGPSSDQHTDLTVLFEYAKLESRVGNNRQVCRIFEKTLTSQREGSSIDLNFHRFVFLRARQELWSSSKLMKRENVAGKKSKKRTNAAADGLLGNTLAKLRALYILWCVWQPAHEPLDSIVKAVRKDPVSLIKGHLHHLRDPEVLAGLEATYRSELDLAIREVSPGCDCCALDTRCSFVPVANSQACVVGYCLHNLSLVVYCSRGLEATCDLYREFLHGKSKKRSACARSRWVWLSYLELMQQHQNADGAFPPISPRLWRSTIERAVQSFPHDTLLLRLFVDAETGATMSQALRNHFLRVKEQSRRQFDSPQLSEWLFTLLMEIARIERVAATAVLMASGSSEGLPRCQAPESVQCCLFHKWGANSAGISRVRATFESMVSQVRTRGCALAWRLYLRFEIALGRVDAARKVFYRALARAPWSKALYMDGVRVLRPYLSEDECQEVVEFMTAKELHVRVEM